MKDWNGNRASVWSTLGASNHTDKVREQHDFYATHPSAIDALRSVYDIPRVVCEPCCGQGHLSKRLEHFGHKVYSSDLIDRGYGQVLDFADMEALPDDCNCILTNPPFKYITQIIRHALSLLRDGGVLLLFIKTLCLEGIGRYNGIYRETPPRYVMPFTGRIICAKNGDFSAMQGTSSAQSYSWFVWEKGFNGAPQIKWIEYNPKAPIP